jgi:hypothetical protein
METRRIDGMRNLCAHIAFAFVLFCAGTTVAMPSQAELSEAQPLVNELMGPLVKDYKAKKKTAAEVGDRAIEFVAEANTQAAKFVLLKGAVHYYALAKEYDKTADTIESIMELVPDLPPKALYEITSKAVSSASAKTASRLVDLNMSAKNRMTVATRLKAIEKDLKSTPADLKLVRMHAELTAAAGDWESALAEFAKLGGEIGQMAKAEGEATGTSAELADFWWSYKPTVGEAKDSIREHSASFYRKAIDNGELDGLKKAVAEKRIAEAVETNPQAVVKTMPKVEYKFNYRVENGKAILTGQPCVSPKPEGVLVVPEKIDGFTVARLDEHHAFKDCDKMTRIVLPAGLESVGFGNFLYGCNSLADIEVAKSNPFFASLDGVLYSKDMEKVIAYPKARSKISLSPKTKVIGRCAFNSCALKEVKVPSGIKQIESHAFECCPHLSRIEFPATVDELWMQLFQKDLELKEIVFTGNAPNVHIEGRYGFFSYAPNDIVIEVKRGSKGWAGPGTTTLPERWPRNGDSRPIRYLQ